MLQRLRLNRGSHAVPNLVVAQRVIDKMAVAARRYLADETGEAMVGLVVPGSSAVPTIYVLDTIPPLDDSAVREWGTFQQGEDLQEEQFWWLQENWNTYRKARRLQDGSLMLSKWDVSLRYLGDWHKQPGAMIQPSSGDLFTARRMIDDPENGLEFMLAPIVTLDQVPINEPAPPDASYTTLVHEDGTQVRIDFWYIDQHGRDFYPISPAIYPTEQLPTLPDYPWHMTQETRYKAEYDLLDDHLTLTSAPVLWQVEDELPLEICILVGRKEWTCNLILCTHWDYPTAAPHAFRVPAQELGPEDDIYAVFETLWPQRHRLSNPADWTWSSGRHLIDYIFALEEAHALAKPGQKQGGAES
jgi:hypothetical protein